MPAGRSCFAHPFPAAQFRFIRQFRRLRRSGCAPGVTCPRTVLRLGLAAGVTQPQAQPEAGKLSTS
eukprot:1582727-Rhodomonas_salina.3